MKRLLSILCGVAVLISGSAAQATELNVIALGGTQAPGMPEGTNYNTSGFERATINALGQVAFKAVVQPSLDTLYFGLPEALVIAAQEGQEAPGSGGQIFCNLDFSNPEPIHIPADNGTLAFSALVKQPEALSCTTSLPGVGIWLWEDSVLTLVALEGQQAADVAEGLIWSDIEPEFRYGEGGVLFRATLHDPELETDLGIGLWTGLPGELQLIALEGEAAADQPGKLYEGFASNLYVNDLKGGSFWTWQQGNGSDRTIYSLDPGDVLSIRWKELAPADDFAAGYVFAGPSNNNPDEWGINNSNHVCFSSEVDHPDLPGEDTLWRDLGPSRQLLASQSGSDPNIGETSEFTSLRDCWINSGDQILLAARADTVPSTGIVDGLWRTRSNGETKVLQRLVSWGDSLFNNKAAYPVTSKLSPNEPHINTLGHVAFEVIVTDSQNEPVVDRNSIWLFEGVSARLVAIAGQEVDPGDGSPVVLSNLDFGSSQDGSGNQDGKPSALGEDDEVVFIAQLGARAYGVLMRPARGDLLFKDGYELQGE